jgi:hypothetical protein
VLCDGGEGATLSGVVSIPSGSLPLANAIVYIPNGPVGPMMSGASCSRCDEGLSGNPILQTTTDLTGSFTLHDVPSGPNIPLVVQVGKWRRQVLLPQVASCSSNKVDPDLTRLPRNQGEGDIPKIALTTGGADALECLMRKIGIDDSEFTPETGTGRVNLYNGVDGVDHYIPTLNNGATFTPAPTFWGQLSNLQNYDILVLACEGAQVQTNKPPAALQAMLDYLNMGGRVYASHWHNYWVEYGPDPMPYVAVFNIRDDPPDPITALIDTSTAGGASLAAWLVGVGGSAENGQLTLSQAKDTIQVINPMLAQQWITIPSYQSVQFMSFNTPIGADEKDQCGRMVLTDIHVASDPLTDPFQAFPTECQSTSLSPQEKALIYMLFDLSSCLQPVIG